MTHRFVLLVALSLLLAGTAQAQTWKVDGDHAFAMFSVSHLKIAPTHGQFLKIGGELQQDPAAPAASKLSLTIQTDSIFSGVQKRDEHLKGPDFFDAKVHPTMTFTSTSWTQKGSAWEVTGDLTIKGVTKSVTAAVQQSGMGPDPWGKTRVGYTAQFSIDRQDFGINYMPDGLGTTVDIELSIEFIQQK